MSLKEGKILYCSIDFGTAGTGCAIGTNAKGIYEHSWDNSENRVGSDRSKTRTAVLVNSHDHSPVAFGDQAYDVYDDRIAQNPEKARKELLFFDYFKMSLSDDGKSGSSIINGNMTVTATTGELAPAIKIFAAAFRSIHKSVFDKLTQSSNGRIRSSDLVWIITVPTLWSEGAKQLMRKSAKLGFPDTADSQIKIAREPEAAALCCRAQQLERQLQLSSPLASLSEMLKPGSHLMVADLGAGTADFSQLQVSTDGTLVETAAASGGAWGGHLIEKKILDSLKMAFGEDAMNAFQINNPAEFHELERNIRNLKHRVDPNGSVPYRLVLPYRFIEFMDLRNNISKYQEKTGLLELPITPLYQLSLPKGTKRAQRPTKADAKAHGYHQIEGHMNATEVIQPVCVVIRGGVAVSRAFFIETDNFRPDSGDAKEFFGLTPKQPVLLKCGQESHVITYQSHKTDAAGRVVEIVALANTDTTPEGKGAGVASPEGKGVGVEEKGVEEKQPNDALWDKLFEGGRAIRYTDGGLLKLSHSFVMSSFEEPKRAIVGHISKILDSNPQMTTLFMVGGFSESKVIQQAIDALLVDRAKEKKTQLDKNQSQNQNQNQNQNCNWEQEQMTASDIIHSVVRARHSAAAAAAADSFEVKTPKPHPTSVPKGTGGASVPSALSGAVVRVLPLNPGLCVMNGAVHFGMNPHLISHRIAKMSFGIQTSDEWDEALMAATKIKEYRMRRGKREPYCSKMFSQFCEVGDLVEVDHKKVRIFKPSEDNQEKISLKIFATPKKGVLFSDDPSMIPIGAVSLLTPMPKSPITPVAGRPLAGIASHASPAAAPDTGCDRDITISMSFGCTEIQVAAHETKSGESVECTIDCLDFELDASAAKLSHPNPKIQT